MKAMEIEKMEGLNLGEIDMVTGKKPKEAASDIVNSLFGVLQDDQQETTLINYTRCKTLKYKKHQLKRRAMVSQNISSKAAFKSWCKYDTDCAYFRNQYAGQVKKCKYEGYWWKDEKGFPNGHHVSNKDEKENGLLDEI